MIPTPDWNEPCLLTGGERERSGALAELVLAATWLEPVDRPQYLIVSPALGELDNEQIDGLRQRPDFPELS